MSKRKRGARTVQGWYARFFGASGGGVILGLALMRFWPELEAVWFMLFFIGLLLHYLWYLFGNEPETDV